MLAYHRVADPMSDPFELSVTARQFEQHLELLTELGQVLPIEELSEAIEKGGPGDALFALTFDDGYADNLHTAKPILERRGMPATVFLATGLLDGTPFWWDQIAQLVLDGETSSGRISVEVDGTAHQWTFEDGNRQTIFTELWELLRPLEHGRRQEIVAAVCSQLGCQPPDRDRSLFAEDVAELAKGDVVTIGAHTVTHPMLSRLTDEQALAEIAESKHWLDARLDHPVTAFSYPYGDYGPREVELVRRAGFASAFSIAGGPVGAGCDALEVPRVVVGHWDAGELERSLGELLGTPRARTRRAVDFGDLRRLSPLSDDWGFDRGTPIDRYYIERFLEPRAALIRGRVLEMADAMYTPRFGGGGVRQLDVLDVAGAPGADYTCRLEHGEELPSDRFDCVVCTQVLPFIYDVHGAVRTLHRILKPGGCLLLTVPGITPLHDAEQYGDGWHWSFTAASISRLCSEVFGGAPEVEVFGNLLAASAFLYGLADSDLTRDELEPVDPDYPVIVGVQAIKA